MDGAQSSTVWMASSEANRRRVLGCLLGELVGRLEAAALDVAGKAVWVLRGKRQRVGAVCLVDADHGESSKTGGLSGRFGWVRHGDSGAFNFGLG